MNKAQKIGIVVFTALYLLVTKVRNVIRGLGIKYTNFMLLSSNETSARVQLSLLLRNSLPFGITVNALQGILYIQGAEAAMIDQTLNLRIDGNSITPVNLTFDVLWSGLATGIQNNILSGDVRTLAIQFVGTITAEGRMFNVNKTLGYYDLV